MRKRLREWIDSGRWVLPLLALYAAWLVWGIVRHRYLSILPDGVEWDGPKYLAAARRIQREIL